MRIVVVGGAGFLGSHLVDRALADGFEVDVVDDLSTGRLSNLADARASGGALKFHHLDVAGDDVATLLSMRSPDVVVHLATVGRHRDPASAHAEAFRRTSVLLDAVRTARVPKIVVAVPASAINGRPAAKDLPVKEGVTAPRGVRGVVARAICDLLEVHRQVHAVEFTALALSNVYGPRQSAEGGVVAAMLDAAERGDPIGLHGDGRQTRDFLYVDDAVDALVRATQRGSGLVVHVGTGEQTPLREAWDLVAGPGAPEPTTGPPVIDDLPRFAVSSARARIHLGWSSWTSLADGVAQARRASTRSS